MQLFYNVKVFFNTKLSKEIISQIFRNAQQLEFCFIPEEAYFNNTDHTITIEAAVDSILAQLKKKMERPIDNTILATHQMRTREKPYSYFLIGIGEYMLETDIFSVSLSLIDDTAWYREPYYLDFDRYIRLLFSICKGLSQEIFLKATDEGYVQEFYSIKKDSFYKIRTCFDPTLPPEFKVDITTLIPDFSYEHVHNLLDHGAKKNWQYYTSINDSAEQQKSLTVEEAVDHIMKQPIDHTTRALLYCRINGIMHELSFRLRFNIYITLTLKPLTDHINFGETVLHALNLCVDFCIAELFTYDARYNYLKTACNDVK